MSDTRNTWPVPCGGLLCRLFCTSVVDQVLPLSVVLAKRTLPLSEAVLGRLATCEATRMLPALSKPMPHGFEAPFGVHVSNVGGSGLCLPTENVAPPSVETYRKHDPTRQSPPMTAMWLGSLGSTATFPVCISRTLLLSFWATFVLAVTLGYPESAAALTDPHITAVAATITAGIRTRRFLTAPLLATVGC